MDTSIKIKKTTKEELLLLLSSLSLCRGQRQSMEVLQRLFIDFVKLAPQVEMGLTNLSKKEILTVKEILTIGPSLHYVVKRD